MSLLKSVIADARPAKPMQRVNTPAAGVAGPMPVARATDNMPMKSSTGRTDAFAGRQSQHEPLVANPPVQQSHRQSSRLSSMRDNHSIPSKRSSQAEKNSSQSPQAKVTIHQQTGHQTRESARPVSQATIVQAGQSFSSAKFSDNSVSLKHHLPSAAASDPATEKKPVVSSRKKVQDKKLKPSIDIPTPIPAQVNNPSPDAKVSGFAELTSVDSRQIFSASNKNRIKPQDPVDKNFYEVEPKQGLVDTAGGDLQQVSSSRELKPDISARHVKPDISKPYYKGVGDNDFPQLIAEPEFDSEEKYAAEMPTTETERSGVDARLHSLEQQAKKQIIKQSTEQVMAAQTTSLLADQLTSQQADLRPAINSVPINSSTSEVRIGQVDVFIEKPTAKSVTTGRSFRPSISMASRHYLRRL